MTLAKKEGKLALWKFWVSRIITKETCLSYLEDLPDTKKKKELETRVPVLLHYYTHFGEFLQGVKSFAKIQVG